MEVILISVNHYVHKITVTYFSEKPEFSEEEAKILEQFFEKFKKEKGRRTSLRRERKVHNEEEDNLYYSEYVYPDPDDFDWNDTFRYENFSDLDELFPDDEP